MNERIFREYDIRGVVGADLTCEFAASLGRAFGTLLRQRNPRAERVSVGRDVRLSSGDLANSLMEGVAETGLDVLDLGVCPTPAQYFSIFHLGLDGGVMVTGSHNPPEYNGFKLSIGKETIHGRDIQALQEIIRYRRWERPGITGSVRACDIIEPYRERLRQEFSALCDSRYRRLRVVIDAGNGTAGIVAPDLLRDAGCDVTLLYCEPDGRFPNHHPDPTVVENLRDLIHVTKAAGADIGIGFDGDADRIGVVAGDGSIVWGDRILVLLAREVLRQRPGAAVIGDVKCSEVLFEEVRRLGGVPIMNRTGHSLIKERMRAEAALLAGEFSGHIFIADRYYGFDDAIYAALRLVEAMKQTGQDIAGLLAGLPGLFSTPEIRIDCPDEAKADVVREIRARMTHYKQDPVNAHGIRDLDLTDGVRVHFDHGWALIRSSNTQPVVVLRVEAEDREHVEQYRRFVVNEFEKAMGKYGVEREAGSGG